MNTEPPVGDDLQRMLVTMKQNVLERATPRPKRRRRRTGIALGIVGVLLLGAAGGGVALGLIPTSITDQPAPTATSTPEPTQTETPSGAPVTGRPTPTPTPTSTRPPYSATDPSTWTISGNEVGPLALGGAITAELDDLDGVYVREDVCPSPTITNWNRDGSPRLIVFERDGTLAGVAIGSSTSTTPSGPTTAEGLGPGSQLDDVRAAYPDLTFVQSASFPDPDDAYSMWTIERDGRHITFQTAEDAKTIGLVFVSPVAEVPTEYCG